MSDLRPAACRHAAARAVDGKSIHDRLLTPDQFKACALRLKELVNRSFHGEAVLYRFNGLVRVLKEKKVA